MPRPIILGVVGDSAAGKTTMTRGLVRILGEQLICFVVAGEREGIRGGHRWDGIAMTEL